MKKILILGAGPFQLPGIKKAVESGCYVITLDYLPENIGHTFSHQSVNCSTTNAEGVLAAAIAYQVDAVVTFSSDIAVPSVAYACNMLHLPGISVKAAEIMTLKNRFREFLREEGFTCPSFVHGSTLDALGDYAQKLRYPLIFKPIDSSGSRGVTKVTHPNREIEWRAFQYAKSFSRRQLVCVEEFIEGTEVGGDGILINGRFAFIAITQKHMQDFVVTGHSLPTAISEEDQKRVQTVLEESCMALGYLNGPLNFDVMVSPGAVYILEMSPRNGGNGIPTVIHRSTGIDVEKATLQLSLGEQPTFAIDKNKPFVGSWVFGSACDGILRHISSLEEVQRSIPEVFEMYQVAQPGDSVSSFIHNGNLLGYALFDWSPPNGYPTMIQQIEKALRLEVELAK